jgi:hypothetical protein
VLAQVQGAERSLIAIGDRTIVHLVPATGRALADALVVGGRAISPTDVGPFIMPTPIEDPTRELGRLPRRGDQGRQ